MLLHHKEMKRRLLQLSKQIELRAPHLLPLPLSIDKTNIQYHRTLKKMEEQLLQLSKQMKLSAPHLLPLPISSIC